MNPAITNPIYIKESQIHKMYCNGFGKLTHINVFTKEATYSDCPFCLRVARHKEKQRLEGLQKKNG